MLRELIGDFEVLAPDVDESSLEGEEPLRHAERISALKAGVSLEKVSPRGADSLIIASDTIVTIDGKIIGKPADYDDAVRTLTTLSGRTHSVITAVTLVHVNGEQRTITSSEETLVTFKKMDEGDIHSYLGMIHYADKAGSYAAQEHGEKIIEKVQGSFTNVIGFPLRRFFFMLSRLGVLDRLPFSH